MKKVALLIAVNERGELLLQHKDDEAPNFPNMWCLFGGGVKPDETPGQALGRELAEELEWQLEDPEYFDFEESDGVRRYGYMVATSKTAEELRKVQHEGDDLGFFTEETVQSLAIAEPHRALLNKFFAQYMSQT